MTKIENDEKLLKDFFTANKPVSYTHLTLPTNGDV